MEIFEMLSFDIGEFVTSPAGIIMIVGIVLLIIGIVLMFMGKGKTDASQPATDEKVAEPSETKEIPVVASTEAPKAEDAPVVNATSVVETTAPVVVESTATTESVTAPPVEPINFNSAETLNETVNPTPVVVAETLDMTTEIKPESLNVAVENPAPVVESLDAPVAEAPTPAVVEATPAVVEATPVVETPAPVAETPVSVYGGANPEVKEVFEEKPREIYGGANPLENTAPIPTQTVKEAYSGSMSATPVAETPAPAVVEAPEVKKEEIETLEF